MSNGRPPTRSMAARCTACSTVFRVVPDQLRVSEGWVRCGRCAEVFNAAENLIDLDTGTPHRLGADGVLGLRTVTEARSASQPASRPTALPASSPAPLQAPASTAPEPGPHEPTQPFRREDADAARIEPVLSHEDTRPLAPAGDRRDHGDPNDLDEWAPLRASSATPAGPAAAMQAPGRPPAEVKPPAAAWAADPEPTTTPAALPSFVRKADSAARWRRPRVRAGMAVASVALLMLLGWQLLFSQRDLAAARWPMARAVLQPACALLGCSLEAPRLIDTLSVESSGLLRVDKSDIYRLSVALRNRGNVEVMLPALDLVLTDPQGQLGARRVLRTAELGAAGSTLAAGRELTLQATLQASAAASSTVGVAGASGGGGGGGVAGYTIELFYP